MTNPYGYPMPPDGAPVPQRRPSGVSAILAGLLGLALCGTLGYLPVKEFIAFGIADLPEKANIVLGLYLGASLLLLIGALLTFFRVLAGAVLLMLGALVSIAAVLTEAMLLAPDQLAEFFRYVFRFQMDDAFVRVAGIAGGPLVFVLAALPPTFRYLRYAAVQSPYPSAGYPRQGW
ncbi:hypothetical protein ORV05_02280 [Amycolatopsis cynarae]|uniref:Uncharacterized protein n=1 Tax=Amycolatopsis cynarae TaxID=2995223 RepID=A0ABY7B3A8_9PSEU|nr:hypothetical protein [Amycolatopsis sp. HUAS 11-8]WAL66666.1 hypothetical protein ORV05_02280 [Amycolatopsis sp. HUAS 11-8]